MDNMLVVIEIINCLWSIAIQGYFRSEYTFGSIHLVQLESPEDAIVKGSPIVSFTTTYVFVSIFDRTSERLFREQTVTCLVSIAYAVFE